MLNANANRSALLVVRSDRYHGSKLPLQKDSDGSGHMRNPAIRNRPVRIDDFLYVNELPRLSWV
jgi:hypothetical protein